MILGTSMDSYWPVSFHAQQTAEKALKGLLTRHQIEFEKLPQRLGEATQLTRFAVADRYPLSGPAIDRDASAQHVALGRKVLTAIETVLRDYLDAGRPSS